MEIAPIPAIRGIPIGKAQPAATGLTAVFDIENFARVSHESYSPGGGRPAGGSEEAPDERDEETEALGQGSSWFA